MDLKEGLMAIREMCKANETSCRNCNAHIEGSTCHCFPQDWSNLQIEEFITSAEKWAENHRKKTWKEVLLERLPNVEILASGVPGFCPYIFFGNEAPQKHSLYCADSCEKCWNKIASDEYQPKD